MAIIRRLGVFGLALLLMGAAAGRVEGQAAKPVKQIEVLKTERTNPEMIKRKMRSKEGEPLDPQELLEDLHRIYEMGFFEDVKRQLIEDEDGYRVTIVVKERPYVVSVEFKGNTEINSKTLTKTIKTKAGSFLFKYHLEKRDLELIKEAYIDKSYFNVEVKSAVREAEGGVVVTYTIKENKPAEILNVTFLGNKAIPEYELKRVMETEFYGFWPDRVYRAKIFENDVENIRGYYRGNGFLESKVDYRIVFATARALPPAEQIIVQPDAVQRYGEGEIGIYIYILITEGVRYKVGTVAVVGNREEVMPSETIMNELTVKTGTDYSLPTIGGDINKIVRLYGDQGYAFARVDREEKFDFENRRVNINYLVTEGNLYYIQDIEIIGNTHTKMQVIIREIDIAKGERFSFTKLMNAQVDLNRIGIFGKISITKRPGSGPDLVIIVVEVEEVNTGAFEVMLSYDEYNKFAGTAVLKQQNFDVIGMFKGHFTGAAHEVALQYFGSPKTNDLSFSINNPRLFDGRNSFAYRISDRVMEFSEYSEDSYASFFSLGREIFKNFRMSIGLEIKDIDIFNVAGTAPAQILDEEGLSRVRAVSIHGALNRLAYHVPFFPSGGYQLGGGVEFGGDFLNATREYIGVNGSLAMYTTLRERSDGARTVWSVRFSGKATNELGDDTAVPLSERSALGGIRTVRGYNWYSIGPYVGDDNVRGDAFLLMSTEIMFPLKWDPVRRRNLIHGLIYYDVGGVWSETGEAIDALKNFELGEMRASVGVGIRMYPGGMPIPIEFYWSLPFAKDGDRTTRFQIGIFGMPF